MRPIGQPEHHYLHAAYIARVDPAPFDDTPFRDEFQREVYLEARRVLEAHALRGVLDVGCGSGYKLVQYFADQPTLGLDTAATVEFLRAKYPGRAWRATDLEAPAALTDYPPPELAICADVLEHLRDPRGVLQFLAQCGARRIVLSTPERDALGHSTEDGPPRNVHHAREWNAPQFCALVTSHLRLLRHRVLPAPHCTQIALCAPR